MGVVPSSEVDPLASGESALRDAQWQQAREHFEQAVAVAGSPEAWDGLSRAAWWLGDQEATLEARERAYRAYRDAGNPCGAALMAMWLASDHLDFRGDDAVASAWLRRGRALVAEREACSELGWITLMEADISLLAAGEPERAVREAKAALEIAKACGDHGLEAVALAIGGSALVATGAIDDGLRSLDEAAALAVGESPAETAAAGWALCHTVSACADVGDFGRAEQWCRAMHTWSATWQARHFFGICRTAYGEVLAASGDWSTAEQELESAIEDLSASRPALAAPSAVRLGRLRARQGKTERARALLESALPLPEAVLALGELDLAAGDAAAAADAAERVLRRLDASSALRRLPALELLALARAALGDVPGAAEAAADAEAQAERMRTPYMRGRGRMVRAHALAAGGDHEGARRAAEDAADLFAASSAPYEAARAQLLLADALAALGRHEHAAAQERAANEALALLGVRAAADAAAGELSAREADILRLVASGLSDGQIAERLFLSPHTVHRHVANVRTKLRVTSRAAAVAHATRHDLI